MPRDGSCDGTGREPISSCLLGRSCRLESRPVRRHLTVGNGVGALWKDERVAEKQTTISAAAGGPQAALAAQDTAGQTAPSEIAGGKE
jgi:hypothetical protein